MHEVFISAVKLLSEAKRIAREENDEYGDRDLEEMGAGPISEEFVQKMADKLSSVIAKLDDQSEETKKRKKKLQKIEKTFSLDFSPRKMN